MIVAAALDAGLWPSSRLFPCKFRATSFADVPASIVVQKKGPRICLAARSIFSELCKVN